MIKVTKDGFVWLVVTEKAKEILSSGLFELYELYDDDSECLIPSMDELTLALETGAEIGIEVGYIYEQNN
jgi:hypothetical protein